jgi:alanyl-tRNA synthetase
LHWALRKVLGEHVKQAGSWVGPDRLRFDFSHYAAVTAEEITEIERLANGETLANAPVRAFETTKDEAEALGAIAFFGDKYGDIVRVLEAGNSVELCGGTHVRATGDIGTIKVVSESSIGSNLRRIEAVTGANSVALFQELERNIGDVADVLGATPSTVKENAEKRVAQIKALEDENRSLRAQLAMGRAGELAAAAPDGVVVARVDDLTPSDLRDLAVAVRQQAGVRRVVLAGTTTTGGVSLVAAVQPSEGVAAADLIREAAKAVGGGGGGKGDIATAGGKDPDRLDDALQLAREAANA